MCLAARHAPLAMSIALALLVSPRAIAARYEIAFSVSEPAGIDRIAELISGGLPLPAGLFHVDQPFALFGDDGSELACQVSPLVVERDGTLRWILVDFLDDVAGGETNRYRLRTARPSASPATALRAEETADGISVDTGRIRFRISRQEPFALFDSLSADGREIIRGGEVSYVQLEGKMGWNDPAAWKPRKITAGPPSELELWYSGPLRVTVEVSGRFSGDPLGAGYKAWITAWAGQSRLDVKYKLTSSNPERYTAILVERSTIALDLVDRGEDVIIGAKEPMALEGDAWMHQGLFLHHTYQDVAGAVKVGQGERAIWTGDGPKDRPAGWMALPGERTLFVCDRFFASNPARRIATRGNRWLLDGIAPRFEGPPDRKFQEERRIGQPWQSEGFWLYDCTHHSSEYLFELAAPADPADLDRLAAARRSRLWLLASSQQYSACGGLGNGRFGSLTEEMACYRTWGWKFSPEKLPQRTAPDPFAFVAWEDNHYESEADSPAGLLLMYVRTGQRGLLDAGEAWARYHMDLQAWRTDGWKWKDGAIWFPQGGPQGNRRVRETWNFEWGPDWGERKGSAECADLWRLAQGKSCYCHYYGGGLADYFCMTGERDALDGAIDDVEQKDAEFRVASPLKPGETPIGSIRGFGRGFEVMMRVLMADPQNDSIRDLCHLCAATLRASPLLDERGFHASKIGGGWSGMNVKELTPGIEKWMESRGIAYTTEGDTVATLSKGGVSWPVRCFGGTWQHYYLQNGADLYARYFDDEDMRDVTIAYAQMAARFLLSSKCHQTWYYTYFDVPDLGQVFDPWIFEHTGTQDGEGCTHSGYYTRFFPDVCAKGYSWTGEKRLLEKAREFWYYGSKRTYQSPGLSGAKDEVWQFATHHPPKDDTVLEVTRLFHEVANPREDDRPPAAITDLQVKLLDGGRALVRFTAPPDEGGGTVARYQVKADALPIVPYEEWDFAEDHGRRRNWWRAVNCEGEPPPSSPGAMESFEVTGVPDAERLHFAVRSFDASWNRSAMSNSAEVEAKH